MKQSFQDWNNTSDVMARLARRLSTTLSLEAQLSILAEEMTDMVPFDSLPITGTASPVRTSFSLAWVAPIAASTVSLEGLFGTLTLHRRQRFSEEELTGIEMMLSGAICHIRNACQFIAIEQTALTDSLTGIGNKQALDEALQRASATAELTRRPWSLILCDLDHFKRLTTTTATWLAITFSLAPQRCLSRPCVIPTRSIALVARSLPFSCLIPTSRKPVT